MPFLMPASLGLNISTMIIEKLSVLKTNYDPVALA